MSPAGAWATLAALVPAQTPAPPPGRGEEFGKSSPLALVVIVLLALATVVLIRSMNKRLRNVPASFDRSGPDTPADADPADPDAADTGGEGSTQAGPPHTGSP